MVFEDHGIGGEPGDEFLADLPRIPELARIAAALASSARTTPRVSDIRNLVITGAGGAALAGDALAAGRTLRIPCIVNRGYELPEFVDAQTLVLAVSASGSSEEAVYAVANAFDRHAQAAVIAGGGNLCDIAEAQGYPLVKLPLNLGTPHFALIPLTVALWELLRAWNLHNPTTDLAIETLERQLAAFDLDIAPDRNPAKQVAGAIGGKAVRIYGSPGVAAVAAHRWKMQLNAVSGQDAAWNAFPDVAYEDQAAGRATESSGARARVATILLRDRYDNALIRDRIDRVKRDLSSRDPAAPLHEIYADGPDPLTRFLSACYLGDWAAAYAASGLA